MITAKMMQVATNNFIARLNDPKREEKILIGFISQIEAGLEKVSKEIIHTGGMLLGKFYIHPYPSYFTDELGVYQVSKNFLVRVREILEANGFKVKFGQFNKSNQYFAETGEYITSVWVSW